MNNTINKNILTCIFTFCKNKHLSSCIEKVKMFENTNLIKIGQCEDVVVCLVNGDIVKTKMFEDFVEGGNDAVYGKKNGEVAKFMPENQVWLDANLDINSIPYVCLHELLERYYMTAHKLHYEKAHEKADAIEMKLREKKVFENCH